VKIFGKLTYYICDKLRVNGRGTGKSRYYICDTLCQLQGNRQIAALYLRYATYKWHQAGKSRYYIHDTRNGTSAVLRLS
jgi:hypothetical protein